jgi:hypothetical protein
VLSAAGVNDDRGPGEGLLQAHVSDANILDGGITLCSVGVCLRLLSAGSVCTCESVASSR